MPTITVTTNNSEKIVSVVRSSDTITQINRVTDIVSEVIKGEKGDPGNTDIIIPVSPDNFSGHRAVANDNVHTIVYADCNILKHRNTFFGITVNAANTGEPLTIRRLGVIEEPSWNWVTDEPIFLGNSGYLVQTPVSGELFSLIVGFAKSPTSILVAPREPITLL